MTALMGLEQILRTAKLQVITDLRDASAFAEFCDRLFNAGVDIIQVRDPKLADHLEVLEDAQQVAFDNRKLLVVGRDLATAVKSGADAFHLGASDGTVAEARSKLHEYALVGRSAHTADDLADSGANYLLVGPTFGDDVPGLALVGEAATRLAVDDVAATPWFAVGGITPDNVGEVIKAGAVRVAVSSCVTQADEPEAVTRVLAEQLRELWHRPDLRAYSMAALGGASVNLGEIPPPPAPGTALRAE